MQQESRNLEQENRDSQIAKTISTYVIQNPGVRRTVDQSTDKAKVIEQMTTQLTQLLARQGIDDCEVEIQAAIQFIFDNYNRLQDLYQSIVGSWEGLDEEKEYSEHEIVSYTIQAIGNEHNFPLSQIQMFTRIVYQQLNVNKGIDKGMLSFLAFSLLLASLMVYVIIEKPIPTSNQLPAIALVNEP